MMFRIALAVLLVCESVFVIAQSADSSCQDLFTEATSCLIRKSITNVEEYTAIDDAACTGCLVSNTLVARSAEESATCDNAIGEICSAFGLCSNSCFPSADVCQQELYDYYVCLFGSALAPNGCFVQCEGSLPSGGDGSSGSDGSSGNGDGLDVGGEQSEENSNNKEEEEEGSGNEEESSTEGDSEEDTENEADSDSGSSSRSVSALLFVLLSTLMLLFSN